MTPLDARAEAQERGDMLFALNRRYSVQMVSFTMLFALNRRYRPGENRLRLHGERCPLPPERQRERWEHAASLPVDDGSMPEVLADLVDERCGLAEERDRVAG